MNMTPEQFNEHLKRNQRGIENLFNNILPTKIGNMAVSHFKANFRGGGFDGAAWAQTARQKMGGKSAANNYKPLTSGRNHLMSSVRHVAGRGYVSIINDVPYAKIHNDGGTVYPTVTDRMKRFAWAKFFESTGIKKGMKKEERQALESAAGKSAKVWKSIALTKKPKLTVKIPQRKFIGESELLNKKITETIETELSKILISK